MKCNRVEMFAEKQVYLAQLQGEQMASGTRGIDTAALRMTRNDLVVDTKANVPQEFPAPVYGYVAQRVLHRESTPTLVESTTGSDKLGVYTQARIDGIYDALRHAKCDEDGNPLEDKTTQAIRLAAIEHKKLRHDLLDGAREGREKLSRSMGGRALATATGVVAGAGVAAGSMLTGLSVAEGAVAGTAAWFSAKAATTGRVSRREYADEQVEGGYVEVAVRSAQNYLRDTLMLGEFADDDDINDDTTRLNRLRVRMIEEIDGYDSATSKTGRFVEPSMSHKMKHGVLKYAKNELDRGAAAGISAEEQLDRARTILAVGVLSAELHDAQNDVLKNTRDKKVPRVLAAAAAIAMTLSFNQNGETTGPAPEECQTHYNKTYDVKTGTGEVLDGCLDPNQNEDVPTPPAEEDDGPDEDHYDEQPLQ